MSLDPLPHSYKNIFKAIGNLHLELMRELNQKFETCMGKILEGRCQGGQRELGEGVKS